MPSHLAFLGFFYALAGLALASLSSVGGALHLIFPLVSGFAIVGPFVAVFLYEMSRRRELGLPTHWRDAFAVVRSPALPAIAALGLILTAIFAAWIGSAEGLYIWLDGPDPPASASGFVHDVLTTSRGHELIAIGGAVGFVFAALALCISVIAFPLLLDRDVGLIVAVSASLRTARKNPLEVACWGAIVAGLLILGSLPLFVGLAVVMPVLGHATWRFYRRAVERDPARERLCGLARRDDGPTRALLFDAAFGAVSLARQREGGLAELGARPRLAPARPRPQPSADRPGGEVRGGPADDDRDRAHDEGLGRDGNRGLEILQRTPDCRRVEIFGEYGQTFERSAVLQGVELALEPGGPGDIVFDIDAALMRQNIGVLLQPFDALRARQRLRGGLRVELRHDPIEFIQGAADTLAILLREFRQLRAHEAEQQTDREGELSKEHVRPLLKVSIRGCRLARLNAKA